MGKGLNSEFEFGATNKSQFVAEHRFKWKPSEILMILFMLVFGVVLAIFVQPILLGLAFVFSSAWLSHVNQTKKKQSILQLFETPEGLKLYHNGKLIEEASDRKMNLVDVREITLTNRGEKEYIAMRGIQDEDGTSPYIKMPLRLLESEAMQNVVKDLDSNPNVTMNSKIYDTLKSIQKEEKKK